MSSSKNPEDIKAERIKEASMARRIIVIAILALIVIFLVGGYFLYNYIEEGLSPVDPDDDELIEVSVPLGSSVEDIANILEENNIISNATIFDYYITFKNETGFQAGDYQMSKSLSMNEIVETLKTGRVMVEPQFTVTIPEGTTLEEIAEIYGEETSIDAEEFMNKMTDEEFIQTLMEEYPDLLSDDILNEDVRYPLEGYLNALTYSFYEEDPTIDQVVRMMLDETRTQVFNYMDQIESRDLTIHEALTMASIIENEAPEADTRFMVSGVFYNRLRPEEGREEMPLQTDPTVLYAKGEHQERVLNEDLEIEHPYNTYQNRGLPPGPISNYRENALEAAVDPEYHNYRYFLHGDDGDIHYAETLEEHQANIDEHRPSND
ncbi:endolytic transglycosylase MltG [Alkalibacillus sp. S2W]|uniref:endolytic transglycosylase MltG n=1 Tax=Alkalibacillus sp. S2W TaxID=3386553 RepID=UPI00398CD394